MNTEEESRNEDSQAEKKDTGRIGYNRDSSKNGYTRRDENRPSYNRENNYHKEGQHSYGNRPQRPYNPYNNREDKEHSQRTAYSREGNSQRKEHPNYNLDRGNNRPAKPYNNRSENGKHLQPPYPNRNFRESGDRPQRPFYQQEDKPWRSNNEERKPWHNHSSSHNNGNEDNEHQRRPRFYPNDNNNRQSSQGYSRPFHRTVGYDPNAKYSKKKQMEYKSLFVDPNEPIRLNKYLSNAGICSRREADELIITGVVTVNEEVVKELGTKIKRNDVVKFHGEIVNIERKVYILLNKPKD
jgi:23S rRNA pseudouridine2605 synthase